MKTTPNVTVLVCDDDDVVGDGSFLLLIGLLVFFLL